MLLKSLKSINWKYILREVLLIFIGINLAIWFNNWNSSKKSVTDKKVAISKIVEEIENNREELKLVDDANHFILTALIDYNNINTGNSSELIATPGELRSFNSKFPGVFISSDSSKLRGDSYLYDGKLHLEFEMPTLNNIAWETSSTINIAREFKYECLYELESVYMLQQRVQREIDKAANALQNKELMQLKNILSFLEQLDKKLLEKYTQILENISGCE